MLIIEGLTKKFGDLHAVDNVSLEIRRGTITGLIGPNGAGKTTLFNVIAGALPFDEGLIEFQGTKIDGKTPDQIFALGLARTFQIPRPFSGMTVLENLMVAPTCQAGEHFWNNWIRPKSVQVEEHLTRDRALEVLEFIGLTAKRANLAGELSGGQQKLLELARVMMIDPALILLDEPAAGVNPTLLNTLVEKIEALHQRGTTFLIIEHNMEVVMGLCEPIVVMAQGKVLLQGNADEVRSNRHVIDAYLGEMPA